MKSSVIFMFVLLIMYGVAPSHVALYFCLCHFCETVGRYTIVISIKISQADGTPKKTLVPIFSIGEKELVASFCCKQYFNMIYGRRADGYANGDGRCP